MAQQDMQNVIQNWMEQQQKFWQEWVQNAQQMAGGGSAVQPWTQGLGHWQEAVEQTLETQKKAIRAWAEQVAGLEGAPEELYHRTFWSFLFETPKSGNSTTFPSSGGCTGRWLGASFAND